jgi:signal transduction histidine kinase
MTSASRGLGARCRRWRDNEVMLRVANFAVRVVAVVFVGVATLAGRGPGAADIAVQIGALAVAIVVLAVWVPTDRLAPGGLHSTALPYALAAMATLCAAASATPRGGPFNLLAAIGTVAAGSDLGPRPGLAVAGLGIVATETTGLALGAGTAVTAGYPLVLGLVFVLGRNLRAHRTYAEQADRLREEQARAAMLDERTRIAREIHDVLAHSLGALGVQIQVARAVLTDQHDQARAVDLLEQAQRMATDGLGETRRAVQALRGEALSLPDSLAALGTDHQRRHGARVTLEVSGERRQLSPDAQLAFTRAARESLVNIVKHAPRQPIQICLDYADTDTSLTIRNHLNGDGYHGPERQLATVNGGYGLSGMRERLLLINGTLNAGRQGDDWLVVATVPQ